MNRKFVLLALVVFALLQIAVLMPTFADNAFALGEGLKPPLQPDGVPGASSDTASGYVKKIINIGLAIAATIAVAFLIYGGFRYITSAGSEEAAEAGKKAILIAIIGLIIIILSFVIITVIFNALKSTPEV